MREHTTGPVYLVVDGHSAHKVKTVGTFVAGLYAVSVSWDGSCGTGIRRDCIQSRP